jgi:hypothetical protein
MQPAWGRDHAALFIGDHRHNSDCEPIGGRHVGGDEVDRMIMARHRFGGRAARLSGYTGYTGFRDDRIDSLGQPGLAGAGASARPPVANGRAKLVLMPSDVQPRKIIINGHPTSVRLEPAFGGGFERSRPSAE